MLPENGVGLLLTQFQLSPPSVPGTAPAGRLSSTQTTALELLLVGVLVAVVGVGLVLVEFVTVEDEVEFVDVPAVRFDPSVDVPVGVRNAPWLRLK